MRYTNTKTGAIVDSPCKIRGGDWIEVTGEQIIPDPSIKEEIEEIINAEPEIEPEVKSDQDNLDGITVKEIKQELDAMGIKYDPKAKKKDLYDLMFKGR